jgi:hypothetical protein
MYVLLHISLGTSDEIAALDIEGPWTFHLRNPKNPKQLATHAGVLEFIAEEGIVHLPAWVSQLFLSRNSKLTSR